MTSCSSRGIGALAAALCEDAGVAVEYHDGPTSFDPRRWVIRIGNEGDPSLACGLLAHEAGHLRVSRYHLLRLPRFPGHGILPHALNGIEDPRAEHWIVTKRFPGAARWLRRVSDSVPFQADERAPLIMTFCQAAVTEPYRGWQPLDEPLPDKVRIALEHTRSARRAYAECVPPSSIAGADVGAVVDRYLVEVVPRLNPGQRQRLTSPWEMLVRWSALQALRLAEEAILPHLHDLVTTDGRRIEQHLQRRPALRRLAGSVADARLGAIAAKFVLEAFEACSDPDPSLTPSPTAWSLLAAVLQATQHLEVPPRAHQARGTRASTATARASYEAARQRVSGQVAQLVRTFEEVLPRRRRTGFSDGYPSGAKVDMRQAMRAEADPRILERVFCRKQAPDRMSTCVSLVIDCSGSMRGEKVEAALSGAALLTETLDRLEVPYAIHGFQDELIVFKRVAEPLSSEVKQRLGEMHLEVTGQRPGGLNNPSYNDDGPCLRQAAQELLRHGASDPVLIVISDGLVEGRSSTDRDLREAIRELAPHLHLVGIGLGPRTRHVLEYYPDAVAEVPVERLAEELGRVLRRVILRAFGPRS